MTAVSYAERRSIAGVGIGLRSPHVSEVLTQLPDVPWFELLADNHMAAGGVIPVQLQAICKHYPVTFHSVGLSLGSAEPLNLEYLGQLKTLMHEHHIAWLSEHLCFTALDGKHSHDLLPIPYSEESLNHMVERIDQTQDFLGEQILVENVSSYMEFSESSIAEVEFVAEVVKRADCGLLIDVNNIYVNAYNQGIDAEAYIDQLPIDRIREIHLAGFEDHGDYILDAHNNPVADDVWDLYARLIARLADRGTDCMRQVPTLIEWDNDIPSFERLTQEADHAKLIQQAVVNMQQQNQELSHATA